MTHFPTTTLVTITVPSALGYAIAIRSSYISPCGYNNLIYCSPILFTSDDIGDPVQGRIPDMDAVETGLCVL